MAFDNAVRVAVITFGNVEIRFFDERIVAVGLRVGTAAAWLAVSGRDRRAFAAALLNELGNASTAERRAQYQRNKDENDEVPGRISLLS